MLFNSFEFALFLPAVFFIYWFGVNRNLRIQNLFLVFVSYLFYGWWDWRFLLLIAFTTGVSFASGIWIEKYRDVCKGKIKIDRWITIANIVLNLLILCLFKYFNFFTENLGRLFALFGMGLDWVTVDILLPVGISFYTFQALSYTIDVYKRKIEPTHDWVSFFAYVSFFPQLVAGPIERATNLLPQFYKSRHFDYGAAVNGMRQILWGLFKKIVVADNCAVIANTIFADYSNENGTMLWFGALMFTFQIYGDFSGYSDIAIGTARLFGFQLMRNFDRPYFSRDIAEFWRRWHISLTTWFRDYIYIPLGGSRGTKWMSFRNTMIIFLVSGLWHGANWTFLVWGAFHAFLFLPLLLLGKNRRFTDKIVAEHRCFPTVKELFQMLLTFGLVVIGWVFFRSDTVTDAFLYLERMFDPSIYAPWSLSKSDWIAVGAIVWMLAFEWWHRTKEFGLDFRGTTLSLFWRRGVYLLVVLAICYFGGKGQTFIYFQF